MFQLGSRSDVTSSPTQIPLYAVVNIEITYSNALSIEIIFSLMKSGKLVDFFKRKKFGGLVTTFSEVKRTIYYFKASVLYYKNNT